MNEPEPPLKTDPSFWLSLFFVVIFAIGVATARVWRWDTRLFPWTIGIPALILAAWQMIWDFRGGRAQSSAEVKANEAVGDIPMDSSLSADVVKRRTLRAIAWIGAFLVSIWLVGFLVAIPIFVLLYLLFEARAGLGSAVLLACCTELFIWGIFDWVMNIAWPEAVLFSLFR